METIACNGRNDKKNLWSFISIVVSFCLLDNCPRHYYRRSLVIGPYESIWWQRFFSRWCYALDFGWSDHVITEDSATRLNSFCWWEHAQFLPVETCGCARSISYFQDLLSVLKTFRLKLFKCPNKENFFFWVTSVSVKFFCSFFRNKSSNLAT